MIGQLAARFNRRGLRFYCPHSRTSRGDRRFPVDLLIDLGNPRLDLDHPRLVEPFFPLRAISTSRQFYFYVSALYVLTQAALAIANFAIVGSLLPKLFRAESVQSPDKSDPPKDGFAG